MTPQNEPLYTPRPGLPRKKLAVALLLVGAVLGLGFATGADALLRGCAASVAEDQFETAGQPLPRFAQAGSCVVAVGQKHGYLLPCGCSASSWRPGTALQPHADLGDKGWEVVAVDLGDLPQIEGTGRTAEHSGAAQVRYAIKR